MMNAEKFKEFFLNKGERPFVIHGMIDDWPAVTWTPETLSDELQGQIIRFRLGKKVENDIQWETHCSYEEATVCQFIEWLNEKCCENNPLAFYHRDEYWCYADYKYMAKMFSAKPHMLKAVQWETFGFPSRCGEDSTLWLGSKGCYTVCHYDTYGCNLVAQICGRKHWTLFSPADTKALYPTRIPYEESSIFSQVNIKSPDLHLHPKYKEAVSYSVTLEPGDVLFIPRQWWHFVESLDTTISVNTWIELECDNRSRLHEAVTRLLACSLMSQADKDSPLANIWLNPTEVATDFSQNMMYIKQAAGMVASGASGETAQSRKSATLDSCSDKAVFSTSREGSSDDGTPAKVQKLTSESTATTDVAEDQCRLTPLDVIKSDDKKEHSMLSTKHQTCASTNITVVESNDIIVSEEFDKNHIIRLKPDNRCFTGDKGGSSASFHVSEEITDKHIINSILHPDVVDVICKTLMGNKAVKLSLLLYLKLHVKTKLTKT